jgi:hypothetical protein
MRNVKTCRKCDEEKSVNKFRIREGANGLFADNICLSCRGRSERSRLWLEMMDALGGKCACCGEDHPQLLTLEHVSGGRHFYGRRYGRDGKEYQQSNTYVEIRRAKREGWNRSNWELLCGSCNFSKGHYGQCPHRSGVTREQVIDSLTKNSIGIGYSHRNSAGTFEKGFDSRRPNQRKLAEVLQRVEEESIG